MNFELLTGGGSIGVESPLANQKEDFMSTATALARIEQTEGGMVRNLDEAIKFGDIVAKSGMFKDASNMAQAVVKIMCGLDMGISPMVAMRGLHVFNGKVEMSAGLLAAKIKESGKYNYRVIESTDARCELEFFENGESIGKTSLTIQQAKEAKLTVEWDRNKNEFREKATWKNFPSDMLFARCISRGCRRFCPDVTLGGVYTPGEIADAQDAEQFSQPQPSNLRMIRPTEVEAVVMIDTETQRAIEELWPKHGATKRDGKLIPLDDFLKSKGINSLAEMPANLAEKTLTFLQENALKAQSAQESKNLTESSPFICGDELADQIREARARVIQLGGNEAEISAEWEAHAGGEQTLYTCDKATAEGWLDLLKQLAAVYEAKQ